MRLGRGGGPTSAKAFVVAFAHHAVGRRRLHAGLAARLSEYLAAAALHAAGAHLLLVLFRLARTTGTLRCRRAAAAGLTKEFTDLQEVGLNSINEAGSLPVLGAGADGNGPVFDDVSDTEAIAGGRAKAKLTETRVATV